MKFNFKKVVPVITGALLLGSTIGFATGVAGADVTYPSSFADSVVVIGAASDDSAAANEIALDLGKLTVSGETTVSEGYLVKQGSSVLNYNEDFQDIDSKLYDSDLPVLLADGTYKDTKGTNHNKETYDQTLEFVDGGNKLVFEANEDDNDKIAPYLKLTDGTVAFNYTLDFSTGPKWDNGTAALLKDDFELTKLNILGTDWTFTDATSASTMKTGESKTLVMDGKSYEVEVTVYSDKAQFVINGESLTIDEGGTDELADGTEVGVTEISTSSKETVADQVEFFLGARKLVLEDGQEVELNGEDVDGTLVDIVNTASTQRFERIYISYTPEDDVWKGVGESWEDPIFGKFKLVFAALQKAGEETIEVSTGADTGYLTVLNSEGGELKINFWDNETHVYLGEKQTRYNLTAGGIYHQQSGVGAGDLLYKDNDLCIAPDIDRCEGVKVLAVDSEGQARIYELKDVDHSESKIKFTDTLDDKDYELDFVNGSNTFDVGLMNLDVTINQTINSTMNGTGTLGMVKFTDLNEYAGTIGVQAFETSLEGALMFNPQESKMEVALYNKTGLIEEFNVTVESGSPNDMQVLAYGLSEEESGDDYYVGLDNIKYGAELRWDSEDKNDLEIVYPGDELVWADMYVAPVGAVVSGGGVVPTVRDTELTSDLKTSKDLVVVGGPAINKIAAELLGLDMANLENNQGEASGLTADAAMIKLFEGDLTPGKVALLVAGYEKKDTAAAAKALVAENQFGDLTTTTASTYSFA